MTATSHDDDAPAEATDAAAWVGRVLDDRYRVVELLGEGAMGAVLAAEHLALRKQVAIKVILPRHAGDEELAARFAREGMVTAQLEHPNVASAIDCGSLPEGGSYLVMRLARGKSLRELPPERRGWRTALAIGLQIADALASAHELEIVHRDLKPDNIVLQERDDGGWHVWVLDFGIARVGASASALTRIGTIMGTPGYMAPEQAVGQPADARADVYALGVVLWELATGRPLFDAPDRAALLQAQLLSVPPRISTLVPDVPPALDQLVARMLASAASDRPTAGAEVREALRAIDRAVPAAAPQPRPSAPSAPGGAAGKAPDARAAGTEVAPTRLDPGTGSVGAGPRRASSPAPRLPWVPIVLAAIAVACLAGSAVACLGSLVLWRGAGSEETATTVVPASPTSSPPLPPPPAPPPAVPATSLASDVQTLSSSPDAAARRAAATRLRASERALPRHVRELLAYELAPGCDERRRAIGRIAELGDPGALPALARIAAAPRTGCGRDGRDDCDRCLRRDLQQAIERLSRPAASSAGAPR